MWNGIPSPQLWELASDMFSVAYYMYLFYFIFFISVCVCVYIMWVFVCAGDFQKIEVFGPLELELQGIVSCLGVEIWILEEPSL